jgi:hypothetical protein
LRFVWRSAGSLDHVVTLAAERPASCHSIWWSNSQLEFADRLGAGLGVPVSGEGEHLVASTYASVARKPFADAFLRFAVSVAADYADRIEPAAGLPRGVLAPLSVRYVRVAPGRSRMTVTFPLGRAGAATTLVYRLEGDPGEPARTREVAPLVGDRGRRLSFTVATSPSKSAVLVLSNGGERPVAYAVSAR